MNKPMRFLAGRTMKYGLFSLVLVGVLGLWVHSSWQEAVAVTLSLYSFLVVVDRVGRQIVIPECIAFIASFELLFMPAVTYWILPDSMPVASETYFNFTLPACLAFYGGLVWLGREQNEWMHWRVIQSAAGYLRDKQSACVVLFLIGLAGFSVRIIWPTAPALVGVLPSYCLFASVLYAHFSGSTWQWLFTLSAVGLLLVLTVREGMFGDLFLWLMLTGLFVAAGKTRPITAATKIVGLSVALVAVLLIQSIKGEYRRNTWGYQRSERTANAALMSDLIADRLANPAKILNTQQAYLSFVRFNQGLVVGSALASVPTREAFANGEVLLSFVYPLIPRLFWTNKPQTGGRENIHRFTTLPQFENTSINLSPVGEGYVNFGYGGILFAGLYGLLLGGVFRCLIRLSERVPSVVLWFPALFIGCLTMETDLLSTWGSLVNTALFTAVLYGVLNRVGIRL